MSDVTIDLSNNTIKVHKNMTEPWRVTLVDTGEQTLTGGRLKRVYPYIKDEDAFCLTYGDGVADIDISRLIKYHKSHGKLATVTAVLPPGRFGALKIEQDNVMSFQEKPEGDGQYINGGFFVLSPKVIDYILQGDQTIWERDPLEKLAADHQLKAFKHDGFWQPIDTLRDKIHLEELWQSKKAPWKIWNDET
jgi:glucose-1-phosphate cytidylyltransferase